MSELSIAGETPTWTLQDRLRKAREHRGLGQSQLAELTGISERSIQNYEAGRTKPRRPQLIAWAMATGVALDWIELDDARPKGLEPLTFWSGVCRAQDARCVACGGVIEQGIGLTTLCEPCEDLLDVEPDGLALAA